MKIWARTSPVQSPPIPKSAPNASAAAEGIPIIQNAVNVMRAGTWTMPIARSKVISPPTATYDDFEARKKKNEQEGVSR